MIIKIKYSFLITVSVYILFIILSLIFKSGFNTDFISTWTLGIGILFILSMLPLHKLLFFGSRPLNPTWISPDEHLYKKIENDYEVTKNEDENSKQYRMMFVLSREFGFV